MKELLTEINMVSNARHTNLVELAGCCVEGGNWMLVYEYLDTNSLTSALLGRKSKCLTLDWPKRAVIFVGTACGLAFLHEDAEPQIVHRDIKGSNVLDKDLIPNIGDFGLARLFPRRKLSGTILMLKERSLGKILKELVLIRILQMEGLIIAFKLKALETEGGSEQSQTEDPKSPGTVQNGEQETLEIDKKDDKPSADVANVIEEDAKNGKEKMDVESDPGKVEQKDANSSAEASNVSEETKDEVVKNSTMRAKGKMLSHERI